MSQDLNQLIETKLKRSELLSPRDLVKSGFFGTYTAVRNILASKKIPSIKVSAHRTLIPREGVVAYLKSCVSMKEADV